MARVLVIGSINRDLVIRVDHHPRPGETVIGQNLQEFPGGKGANQAIAAARLGADVVLLGAVGTDGFGRAMRETLLENKIDLSLLLDMQDSPTGIATITVDRQGENAIVVAPGANLALRPSHLEALAITPEDIVLAQCEIPLDMVEAAFAKAQACGAMRVFNPAPMRSLSPALLAMTDLLIVNETELAQAAGSDVITHEDDRRIAMQHLLASGIGMVLVTLGAKGCHLIGRGHDLVLAGHPVIAIDTTGAGDCFVGAMAAGLAAGLPMEACLARANRAASLSVTQAGASSSMPYLRHLV